MFLKKASGLAGAVLALVLVAAQPVLAQEYGGQDRPSSVENQPGQQQQTSRTGRNERRERRERAPTPEEIKQRAQPVIAAAGIQCTVTEAINPGNTAERQAVYEVACAEGPGYFLVSDTPPQAFNCIELEGAAAAARLRGETEVGQLCTLPANQNSLAVISGWAREAGVACAVDEAVLSGKNGSNPVYEVGCPGVDGYVIEKTAEGWQTTECLQMVSNNRACRFTTAKEQADGFEPKLAGTEAAGCDVAQVRIMGQNANGRFYEAKCAADGEGYIARLNAEGVTQQIYPCAVAQNIGGGCTLTPSPAVATTPAPAATPQQQ